MSILNIKIYGEEILRKKAEPVREINKKIVNLINDMSATMYQWRGVGLAAPQVGVSKRIIVIDTAEEENKGKNLLVLINPEIVEKEGRIEEDEGCLSVPGIRAIVKRFAEISVTGLNTKGKLVKITASDLLSRIIQHEVDHLDGILFVDHLSFAQKFLLRKKLKELKKRTS